MHKITKTLSIQHYYNYIEACIRFYTLSCDIMDKFPIFYPLHLHILNKITTFAAILRGNIFNA